MKKIMYLFMFGCMACSTTETTSNQPQSDSLNMSISDEQKADIAKILYSIPSPMQLATLLEGSGAVYDASLLNPASQVSNYQTSAQASLNLGVYTTDMAYTNVFKKRVETIKYFTSIQKLGDKIGIGSIFSNYLLERLEKNQNNPDSLLAITTEAFLASNQYLSSKNRDAVATAILVGGFVEGLYLSVSTWKKNPKEAMARTIAEQKPVVLQMIEMVQKTKAEENINKILPELKELQLLFNEIQIQYTSGETKVDSSKKLVVIKNSAQPIFTQDILEKIHAQVLKIRQLII